MSEMTGRNLAFLAMTTGALPRLLTAHPFAAQPMWAEDPAPVRRGQITLDRA